MIAHRRDPPWFYDHRNIIALGRKLVAFESRPSLRTFLGVLAAAPKARAAHAERAR